MAALGDPGISAHHTPKRRQVLLNRGMPLKSFVTEVEWAASSTSDRALVLAKEFCESMRHVFTSLKSLRVSSLVADAQQAMQASCFQQDSDCRTGDLVSMRAMETSAAAMH